MTARPPAVPPERELILSCPCCGDEVEQFVEDYCAGCHAVRQRELDEHNERLSWWGGLTNRQRDAQIRNAVRLA